MGFLKGIQKSSFLKSQRLTGRGPGTRKSQALRGQVKGRGNGSLPGEVRLFQVSCGPIMELILPILSSSSKHVSRKEHKTVFFHMFSPEASLWSSADKGRHGVSTPVTVVALLSLLMLPPWPPGTRTVLHVQASSALLMQLFPHWNPAKTKLTENL